MKININVTPNARVSSVAKIGENSYKVKVDAPAMENKANNRLIELLSEHFNVSKSHIRILKGLTSRNKIVEVDI